MLHTGAWHFLQVVRTFHRPQILHFVAEAVAVMVRVPSFYVPEFLRLHAVGLGRTHLTRGGECVGCKEHGAATADTSCSFLRDSTPLRVISWKMYRPVPPTRCVHDG